MLDLIQQGWLSPIKVKTVPLGMDLGPHATSDLHVVCAKSALGVARVRAVAELLKEELIYAEKLSKAAFG